MSRGATRKHARGPEPSSRLSRLVRPLRMIIAGIGLLAAFGLVLVGGWKLAQLPVERVVFSGDLGRVPQARLEAMVSDKLDSGFLSIDIEEIRAPLQALPWVFKVVVKRRWPSHLEIVVTEQVPIARWGDVAYLNQQGEVFAPIQYEAMPELPLLEGPQGSQLQLMQRYQYIREQLQPLDLEVVALQMDQRGGLVARLHTGSELVFGRGQLERKLARFMGVYYADLADKSERLRSVDLRYGHGLAVAMGTG